MDRDSSSYGSSATGSIRIPKTAEVIAARIRKRIITGVLEAGANLPSESNLISEFGVSRPTIREAVRILESEGLISVSRGARGGARVQPVTSDFVSRTVGLALQSYGATIGEVYETRMIIEPPAARFAAERRPREVSALLRAHVMQELEMMGDSVRLTKAIADFHRLLLEQCGNKSLGVIAMGLSGVFERHLNLAYRSRRPEHEAIVMKRLRFGLRSHSKLVDLIEEGNGPGSEAHWTEHMRAASKVWLQEVGATSVIDILD